MPTGIGSDTDIGDSRVTTSAEHGVGMYYYVYIYAFSLCIVLMFNCSWKTTHSF